MKASEYDQQNATLLYTLKELFSALVHYQNKIWWAKRDDSRFWEHLCGENLDFSKIHTIVTLLDNTWIPEDRLVKYCRDNVDFDMECFDKTKDCLSEVLKLNDEKLLQRFFSLEPVAFFDRYKSITQALEAVLILLDY